jgi:hypothetical protein
MQSASLVHVASKGVLRQLVPKSSQTVPASLTMTTPASGALLAVPLTPPCTPIGDEPPCTPIGDEPPCTPIGDEPPCAPIGDEPPWFVIPVPATPLPLPPTGNSPPRFALCPAPLPTPPDPLLPGLTLSLAARPPQLAAATPSNTKHAFHFMGPTPNILNCSR